MSIYPTVLYELTQSQEEFLLAASRPTPVMYLSGGAPVGSGPQENANMAWRTLGKEMGFDWETVRPAPDKGVRFFYAVPSETEEQEKARLDKEENEKRLTRIDEVRRQLCVLNEELEKLELAGEP